MATMHDPIGTYAQRYDAVADALQQAERAYERGHLDDAAYETIKAALAMAEKRYAVSEGRGHDGQVS